MRGDADVFLLPAERGLALAGVNRGDYGSGAVCVDSHGFLRFLAGEAA